MTRQREWFTRFPGGEILWLPSPARQASAMACRDCTWFHGADGIFGLGSYGWLHQRGIGTGHRVVYVAPVYAKTPDVRADGKEGTP